MSKKKKRKRKIGRKLNRRDVSENLRVVLLSPGKCRKWGKKYA